VSCLLSLQIWAKKEATPSIFNVAHYFTEEKSYGLNDRDKEEELAVIEQMGSFVGKFLRFV
jgi:hypothetical protein